jgi:hypothetical protein
VQSFTTDSLCVLCACGVSPTPDYDDDDDKKGDDASARDVKSDSTATDGLVKVLLHTHSHVFILH